MIGAFDVDLHDREALRPHLLDQADESCARLRRMGLRARVVIPPLGSRSRRRRYSKRLYNGRNRVERYWNRVKQYRRVATRYDKLDVCYLAFVQLASIRTVLRHP